MNKWIDKETFIKLLKDGQSIMFGGFLACGTPELLIDWIMESHVKDLTMIGNDAGWPTKGIGKLIANNQVKRIIVSHIGTNPEAGKRMHDGNLIVTLVPQGSLIEKIRAFGAGLGGILTPTGFKTIAEENKRIIDVQGVSYLLEEPLGADIAIIEARQADDKGNLVYDKTARNFNPVIATAAKTVIACTKERVSHIDPECVITPHIFIDFLVKED
ncbi:MAG: 3-oxoacid CoA-transferase subunit A [Bacillota bacterium]|nr:MAG: 3-oxoacid CoA-transferase subunit A [Bacillota bacterium]